MTDQNMPADKVREIANAMRAAMRRDDPYYSDGAFLEDMSGYIRDLEALLPTPPLPTLKDMTEEERAACQWMQCDVKNHRERYVIATPDDGDGEAALIDADGGIDWIFPEYVTPRPDLPRMTWPGTEKSPPALPDGWRFADHEEHGRVIVTNPTPDCYGTVYFAFPRADCLNGFDWKFCDPDELTYLD